MSVLFSQIELNLGFKPEASALLAAHVDKDLVAYSSGSRLFAFSLLSNKRLFAYPTTGNQVMHLQFLGDSLFSISTDGVISVYESHTGRLIASVPSAFEDGPPMFILIAKVDPASVGSVFFNTKVSKSIREIRIRPGSAIPFVIKYKFPDERASDGVLSMAASHERLVTIARVRNARHIIVWPISQKDERITNAKSLKIKESEYCLISYCPYDNHFIFSDDKGLYALTPQCSKEVYNPPFHMKRVLNTSPSLSGARVIGYNMYTQRFMLATPHGISFCDINGEVAQYIYGMRTPVFVKTSHPQNTPAHHTFVYHLSISAMFDFGPSPDVELTYFNPSSSGDEVIPTRLQQSNGITLINAFLFDATYRDCKVPAIELPSAQVIDVTSYQSREGIIKIIAQQCNINLLFSDLYDVKVAYDGYGILARLLIKEDWSYFVIDLDKNTGALLKVWPLDLDESGFEYDSIVSFGRVETRCFFLTASEKGICGYCLDVTVGVTPQIQVQIVDVPLSAAAKGDGAVSVQQQSSGHMSARGPPPTQQQVLAEAAAAASGSSPTMPNATGMGMGMGMNRGMGAKPGFGMNKQGGGPAFSFQGPGVGGGGTTAFTAKPMGTGTLQPGAPSQPSTMLNPALGPAATAKGVAPLIPGAASAPAAAPAQPTPAAPAAPTTKTEVINDGVVTREITTDYYVCKIVAITSTMAQLIIASSKAVYLAAVTLTGCAVNLMKQSLSTHYLSSSNYLMRIVSDNSVDLLLNNGICIVYQQYIEWLHVHIQQGVLAFSSDFSKNRIIQATFASDDDMARKYKELVVDVQASNHIVVTNKNVYLITPKNTLMQYIAIPVHGPYLSLFGKRTKAGDNEIQAFKLQIGVLGAGASTEMLNQSELYPLLPFKACYYCNKLMHMLQPSYSINPEVFTLTLIQLSETMGGASKMNIPNLAEFLILFLKRYADLARSKEFYEHHEKHEKTIMKIFSVCVAKQMFTPFLLALPYIFTYHTNNLLLSTQSRGQILFNMFSNLVKLSYSNKHLMLLVVYFLSANKTFFNSGGTMNVDLFDLVRSSSAMGLSPAVQASLTKNIAAYTDNAEISFLLIGSLLCLFEERNAYCEMCLTLLACNISVQSILQYLEKVRNSIVKDMHLTPAAAIRFIDNVDGQRYSNTNKSLGSVVSGALDTPFIPAGARGADAKIIGINTALFHIFGIDPSTGMLVGVANPKGIKPDPLVIKLGGDSFTAIENSIVRPSPYDLYRICEVDLLNSASHAGVNSLFQHVARPIRSLDYASNESIYPKKLFRQYQPDALSVLIHLRIQSELGKNRVKVGIAARPVADDRISAGSLADVGDGPFINPAHKLLGTPSAQTVPLMSACNIGCFMFDMDGMHVKVKKIKKKKEMLGPDGQPLPFDVSHAEQNGDEVEEYEEESKESDDEAPDAEKAQEETRKAGGDTAAATQDGADASAEDANKTDAPASSEAAPASPTDAPSPNKTVVKPAGATKRQLVAGDDDDDWGETAKKPTRKIAIMSSDNARKFNPSATGAVSAGYNLKVVGGMQTGFGFGKPMFKPAFNDPAAKEEAEKQKEPAPDTSSLPVYDVGPAEVPHNEQHDQNGYSAHYGNTDTNNTYQQGYYQDYQQNQYQQDQGYGSSTYGDHNQGYGQSYDYGTHDSYYTNQGDQGGW